MNATTKVKLIKRLPDGRIVFEKDGVYFTLDKEQRKDMKRLLEQEE